MLSNSVKILLTGLPGCGKTTAILKIIDNLKNEKLAGFYTQEVRQATSRKGFRWMLLDGTEGILAHTDIKSPFRVGKYRVDVAGFKKFVVPVLDPDKTDAEIFIIDEIGKMECLSEEFVVAVRRLFESDKSVLAAIAQKGAGFIKEIKSYSGAKLFFLTHLNRDKIIAEMLQILSP